MGGKKKKNQTQPAQNGTACKQSDGEKKFVNLLPVYTIYKQKFRRLTKVEFYNFLCKGAEGKRAALKLCEEFMKSKNVPFDTNFSQNIGFLNPPRIMPLIALIAERSEYKFKPSTVKKVNFSKTPERFKDKFSHLMVYGFWFLGRVISDSLSVKDQVNRGNMFNFAKGDMGYWWAGVKILDWNFYLSKETKSKSCYKFVCQDPPKYQFYSSRAIINMGHHPKFFLTETDWANFSETVKLIKHASVPDYAVFSSGSSTPTNTYSVSSEYSDYDYGSEVSFLSSGNISVNTLASRESVD